MLFWIVLFITVVVISFLLALWSMKDYKAAPLAKNEYGLFLIRNTKNFTPLLLESIAIGNSKGQKPMISVERLIKGPKAALAIYAPREALMAHLQTLNLLELEDYTDVDLESVSLWEVGLKKNKNVQIRLTQSPFSIPLLHQDEQVWEQVCFKGSIVQIRAAAIAASFSRRKEILEKLVKTPFIKIPRPFSAEKMLKFYKLRSLGVDEFSLKLNPEDIINTIILK